MGIRTKFKQNNSLVLHSSEFIDCFIINLKKRLTTVDSTRLKSRETFSNERYGQTIQFVMLESRC